MTRSFAKSAAAPLWALCLPPALVFTAAMGDFRFQDCLTWPDAGNCSDARRVMWLTGVVIVVLAMGGLLLWRRND